MPFEQQMKLLLTIPRVGLVTAASFIATAGDPSRFPDADEQASYVGEAFTVKKLNVELKLGLKLKPVMYQLKRAG